MKVKIAVIEFDYHAEVLRNTLHILNQPGIEVSVFTTQAIWKQVNWNGKEYFKLRLQDKEESLKGFILSHLAEINANNIVLFNTIASNYKFWTDVKITCTTLLRIHNSNAYFNPMVKTFKPKLTPFYLWKDSSHLVRKTIGEMDWHFRKKLIERVDHFAFPSKQIMSYALENYSLSPEKTWTLPFGFWQGKKDYPENTSESFKICVIGKVDQRNRDYDTLVSGIANLLPFLNESGKNLELVLLGKANSVYGKKIVGELEKMPSKNFKITSFSDFVPQEEFDQHVATSDFFIIPTKIKTRYTIHEELYGYTKISGSINDVIKYHKPALIFEEYPIDERLQPLFLSYSSNSDLADKIQDWMESKSFRAINTTKVLADYELKSVQKLYKSVFEHILLKGS